MGPTITYLWRLQFVIKVSARSYLHATCTYGTLLHPTCTCGTCSYSSVTFAIHHKSLRLVLSPSDVYLRDRLASDLWYPMAYVSRVPVGPFSISIRHVGPDALRVTCTCGTIWPVGPYGSGVTCTCGTRRLACHLYLQIFSDFYYDTKTWVLQNHG
jgi:hypothetical protein